MTASDVATEVGLYLLVALLSFLWALTEILQAFRSDVPRALKSGWSWLLFGVNAAFALLVFALVRALVPPPANPCLLALGVGAAWQALLRTRVNLLQPLTPEAGEAVSFSLSDLYARFQGFCREQIDQSLVTGRTRLLEQATERPIEVLERQVRLYGCASQLHEPEEVEDYLTRLQNLPQEERALLLASYLLRQGGYAFLQERLEAMKKEKAS